MIARLAGMAVTVALGTAWRRRVSSVCYIEFKLNCPEVIALALRICDGYKLFNRR
jgi:hypothetical protein